MKLRQADGSLISMQTQTEHLHILQDANSDFLPAYTEYFYMHAILPFLSDLRLRLKYNVRHIKYMDGLIEFSHLLNVHESA